ncbi:MAG TPA: M20/M25/M40 family metallo-hydrolase [Thermoanaerobaculia bacterium]|nr:M20/M25/M40 family metallo-hydrolase [Thermoanaerobaculia bacterium]
MKSARRVFAAVFLGAATFALTAARPEESSDFRVTLERLVRAALQTDGAYDTARGLTDTVGPRLSGSPGDARSVAWAEAALRARGFSNVHAEAVTVPHWERGEEGGEIVSPVPLRLSLCALGGSVGTPPEGIEADVVEAQSLEGVDALGEKAKGRIVLVWKVMERRPDGSGYGATVPIRGAAASRAAKLGAVGALIRSVATSNARLPHTGSLRYEAGVPKIPAAALAVPDADLVHRLLAEGKTVRVRFALSARTLADATSANVLGEIPGREKADEIVVLGGHLDSWDLGQGAVDDAAGLGIAIEAARLVGQLPKRPRRTLRVVAFANEENGLAGARAYAKTHAGELPAHVAAIECDSGAGRVSGFGWTAGPSAESTLAVLAEVLKPFGIGNLKKGGGGADVGTLRAAGVPLFSPIQDVSRYFDVHHSADDTFDKIDREEMNTGVAAVAALAYALAEFRTPLERIPEAERAAPRRER